MIAYLDSSAVVKLLVEEAESAALARYVDHLAAAGTRIVSSVLLETELRRFAVRTSLPQADITAVLNRLDLLDAERSLFAEAGLLPGEHLRSLDALHVATALRAGATEFLAYDVRQLEAADAAGLALTAPA